MLPTAGRFTIKYMFINTLISTTTVTTGALTCITINYMLTNTLISTTTTATDSINYMLTNTLISTTTTATDATQITMQVDIHGIAGSLPEFPWRNYGGDGVFTLKVS